MLDEAITLQRRLDDTEGYLRSKLKTPLLDKAGIAAMVQKDERLKTQKRLELQNLLEAQEVVTASAEEEETSRMEWEESIWHWQELQDASWEISDNETRGEGKGREWTTKEIFANREKEMDFFRKRR